MCEDNLEFETETLDPELASMMSVLGIDADDKDVTAIITETASVSDDEPNPYMLEGEAKPYVVTEPTACKVVINGKVWLDVTDVIGNSEEIMALHTVMREKKDNAIKLIEKTDDGVLRRKDRL